MPARAGLPAATEQMEPDSLFTFTHTAGASAGRTVFVALETDCDTEEQKRWKAKIRRHVAWTRSPDGVAPPPFAAVFGPGRPLLAVVVAPRKAARAEGRCETLLTWTEEELTALGLPADAERMFFTYLSPATTAPEKFFFGATSWLRPFAAEACALLAPPSPA